MSEYTHSTDPNFESPNPRVVAEAHQHGDATDLDVRPGAERYNLTANAHQMVQCAPYRFVRFQLLRGLFAASYARLREEEGDEAVARLRTKVHSGEDFTGLTLEETQYKLWRELARACKQDLWAKDEGTGSWAAFP